MHRVPMTLQFLKVCTPAQSKKWECSKHCKPLSEFEVNAMVVLGQPLICQCRKSNRP